MTVCVEKKKKKKKKQNKKMVKAQLYSTDYIYKKKSIGLYLHQNLYTSKKKKKERMKFV